MQKKVWIPTIIIGVAIAAGVAFYKRESILAYIFKPTPTIFTTENSQTVATASESGEAVTVVAENLQVPWEIVFLPDQSVLVTERPGRLVRISADTKIPIPISGVRHVGEGGLMGLALHPQFAENQLLYLYLTTTTDGGLSNRVERYKFNAENNSLSDRKVILENIPGAANHDGGRIAFGPDGFLYIATGDAQNEDSAQNTELLSGKILRLTAEGTVPSNNPFNNMVYTYGHRNPQGLAWDGRGRLWATEHGPSGVQTGNDEVNLVKQGQNYGWPLIKGTQTRVGMVTPVIESGTAETWAPGGVAISGDMLYFVGLRGEALYAAKIDGEKLTNVTAHFREEFGRLRGITVGPDGALYISTSNTDGRGSANENDDKIIRIRTNVLTK